jgi:hypothetical protein
MVPSQCAASFPEALRRPTWEWCSRLGRRRATVLPTELVTLVCAREAEAIAERDGILALLDVEFTQRPVAVLTTETGHIDSS